MAVHDFWCPVCGQVLPDVNISVTVGAAKGAPEHCGQRAQWIPQVGRMDAANGPGFQAFDARDGQNRRVRVDSLKKLRAIERQSEADAKEGRGQPVVWRRYSQDRSNLHTHTLAPGWTGGAQPDPAFVQKHGAAIRRSAEVADTEYGPGISDATPSALDHLSKGDA